MDSTLAAGIFTSLIGNATISFGSNLLRFGHLKREQEHRLGQQNKHVVRYRSWVIGFVLFKLGNFVNFAALSLAAQSIIAAFAATQLITGILFAYILLAEKPTTPSCVGILIIATGVALVATNGAESSDTVEVPMEGIELLVRDEFLIYLSACMAVSFTCALALTKSMHNIQNWREVLIVCLWPPRRKKMQQMNKYVESNQADIGSTEDIETNTGRQDNALSRSKLDSRLIWLLAGMSAPIGTYVLVFAKLVGVSLRQAITGSPNVLLSPLLYLYVALMIIFGAFWDRQINRSLRLFKSTVAVPVMLSCWSLMGMSSGGIFFKELQTIEGAKKFTLFGLGIALVLFGVIMVTSIRTDIYRTYPGNSDQKVESANFTNEGRILEAQRRSGEVNLNPSAYDVEDENEQCGLDGLGFFSVPTFEDFRLSATNASEDLPSAIKFLGMQPVDTTKALQNVLRALSLEGMGNETLGSSSHSSQGRVNDDAATEMVNRAPPSTEQKKEASRLWQGGMSDGKQKIKHSRTRSMSSHDVIEEKDDHGARWARKSAVK